MSSGSCQLRDARWAGIKGKPTRNPKQVPTILIRKHIIKLIEPAPCNAAQTQGARLMRRKEDTVLRRRPFCGR